MGGQKKSSFLFLALSLIAVVGVEAACDSRHKSKNNIPINVLDINRAPAVAMNCPANAGENTLAVCALDVKSADNIVRNMTCSLNVATTCSGVILTGCTQIDIPAQGEAAGPGACDVVVDAHDDNVPPRSTQGSYHLIIDEENQAPTIAIDCPPDVIENNAATCGITVSDADISPQQLSCSLNAATTCAGVTLSDCASADVPAQGSIAGLCTVVVDVQDDFDPPGATQGSDTMAIVSLPHIVSTAPTTAGEGMLFIYNISSVNGTPPVTCFMDAGNTCNGWLSGSNNCTYYMNPDHTVQSCIMGVNVQDSYSPPNYADNGPQLTTITINRLPSISLSGCPTKAVEGVPYTCSAIVTDPDTPAQVLTCAKSGMDSCNGVLSGENNCTYTLTPGADMQSCVIGMQVTDDGTPPNLTPAYATMNVAVQLKPTWQVAPVNITINSGSSYNKTNGTAKDLDSSQTLTCSSGGTNCQGFTPAVSGSKLTPVNCAVSFTASKPQTCNLRIQATDNGTPALSIGQTISITVPNRSPTWTTAPVNIAITSGSVYNRQNGVGTDPDSGHTLTCSSGGTSCVGFTPVVSGASAKPVNCSINFTAGTPQTCNLRVQLADDAVPALTIGKTITITISNSPPIWSTSPSNICAQGNTAYVINNGHATDTNLPNTGPADPGHLTCAKTTQTCSFPVTVSGSGNGAVDCNFSFTTNNSPEVCSVGFYVSDGSGATISGSVPITVSSGIFYVKADATGTNNGTSWADAYTTIQDPMARVCSGSQVWVAEGTYTRPGGSAATESVLKMTDGALIYGGFVGTESSLSERGKPKDHPTIIDGQNTSYHVVIGASNASLNGFTIQNGNANGTTNNSDRSGAGMFNSASSNLVVANCAFRGNTALNQGGAIYNSLNASPAITNCIFIGNSAPAGGAIADNSAYYSLTNCLFILNSATGIGGAIFTSSSTSTITNCTFSLNSAKNSGAIAIASNSHAHISNSILWGNSAPSDPQITKSRIIDVTYSDIQGGFWGVGNIDADPLFAGMPDFRLLAGSPCIDSATSSGAPSNDLDGNPRPYPGAGGIDMGAYEFGYGEIDLQTIWYVDIAASGANNGTSWANAFNKIQDGVNAADIGEEVWVAEGIYINNTAITTDPVLRMKNGVMIYGGFAGWETNRFERQITLNRTILDGRSSSYHVVIGASSARLDGFTVRNGNANGTPYGPDSIGGGMSTSSSAMGLIMANCEFRGNTASFNGGGIYNSSCATITNCSFLGNYSTGSGGAILNSSSDATITNCLFSLNIAWEGGGIYNQFSSSAITNCTFNANSAMHGGAVGNDSYSHADISNSILWGDTALMGAEIYDDSGATNPTDVTFSDVQGGFTGIGNIDADPMFAGLPDFHLLPGSPCIDSGTPDGAPSEDLDINPRPYPSGGGYDMGAYEYGYGEVVLPTVWYVDISASGANNGTSWADAFNNIQDGVNAAAVAEDVWVAEGVYVNNTAVTTDPVLSMKRGVMIYGGFAGGETTLSQRNIALNETILDGQNSSHHVVIGASSSIIDGFTIKNGNANGTETDPSGPDSFGGGMYVNSCIGPPQQQSNIVVANCTFQGNTATNFGGGLVYFSVISPTIKNCVFSGNSAMKGGGGVTLSGTAGMPLITDCVFSLNSANSGAGFYNSASKAFITNSIFRENTAANGAGINNYRASSQVINCTFSQNSATITGGAIVSDSMSQTTIVNSILWGDSAPTYPETDNNNTGITYSDIQGGYTGVGNINIDPLFIGYPDVHLQNGSQCINAGTATGAPLLDFDGYPRPYPLGGAFDMGAYEWHP